MVAIAEEQQELAILFLDFEFKAYDIVDWDFMEGTLLQMGFPMQWIRDAATLYRTVPSSLLFVGDVGSCRFSISRLVRQGCPLATFWFILTDIDGIALSI